MECSVCVGTYNKTIRKKVVCPFCHYEYCKSCAQAYILSIMDDPHCMNCKQAHDREFVDSFCTRLFRNRELRLHRENVLFDREKARMPETQPYVNKIIEARRLRAEYRKLGNYLTDLIRARTKLEYLGTNDPNVDFIPTREDRLRGPEYRDDPRVADKISEIDHTIEESRENLSILRTNIQNMTMDGWDGRNDPDASKKFIRKCPTENCKGFLSEDWKCGLCEKQICKKCNEEQLENHVCDPDIVKTMKLINKDTRACPKCGILISRVDGCNQMWCTDCHTGFDWRTGTIVTGRIHNPHYFEFKKRSREHGDIPCGGIPGRSELEEVNACPKMFHCRVLIFHFEQDLIYRYGEIYDDDNLRLRISYMLNSFPAKTDTDFKRILQQRDKWRYKIRDIQNILQMFIDTGGDLLRQYILADTEKRNEICEVYDNLIKYTNTVIDRIQKRYTSRVPHKIMI